MDRILQYEVAQTLGKGKNGAAYLAVDSGLQRAVVVKSLERTTSAGDESRRTAFLDQMERFNNLDNTRIARFYSLDQAEGRWIVVREYVEGQTAADLVKSGPLSYARWLDLALELARTLKVVHDACLAHGNITTGNVFVTATGSVRLTDVGLGTVVSHRDDYAEDIYVAPELVDGNEATAAGDLYALGVVLFYLLSGRMPNAPDGESGGTLFDGISETRAPGVARLLVRRLMAPDPNDRFGSTDELILTLQGMISLGTEPQMSLPPRKWSPTPRQYLMVSLLVLLLIILWLAISSQPR
ncbi:MAG: serine/threonine-protein kinase [candidate division Zixibacteria bacterium]|nr:serine/threonine-protein kinase [candidate division Zixibacteria bacterium]